jgi:Zn-dependent protease
MSPPQFQETSVLLALRVTRSLRFSVVEGKHLLVGTALVAAAGATFFLGSSFTVVGLIVAIVLFSAGFILHELAHKFVAQGYGLWAEFRLSLMGALLTAMSVLSPLKFIAPGAVMISGSADKERMGRTAIAGPIVNVILAAGLVSLVPIASGWLLEAILAGAAINSFLAVFNLIPFAIFDGQKVYAWSRKIWAILFIASLGLTVYTNFVLRP